MLNVIPTGEMFAQYRVTNPNFAEVVRQPLYDYQIMPGAGAQQLSFFQVPVGQGVTSALGATVGNPKTLSDTNMNLGGQLPSGFEFLCEAIQVEFYPGSVNTANTYTPGTVTFFAAAAAATVGGSLNDCNTFWQGGLLEFNVLGKNYSRVTPLIKLIPAASFDLSAAVASNSATVGEVGAGVLKPTGQPYDLLPPVSLQPSVNFEVTIKWPAAQALPTGFNGRVGVILDGWAKRAGQ
jgi:hypothetical protein